MGDIDVGPLPIMPPDLLSQAMPALMKVTDKITDGPSLEKAAKGFESILLHRIMEEMRKTVPDSGLLESGVSDQVQGLFWFYLAQDVADKGGLGLAKELARQLKRGEEAVSKPAAEEKP
jgi:Rod binding domain-containing protein